MEKLTIGFLADVLYLKGVITFSEFEDIQDAVRAQDLETIIEKMLGGGYDEIKQGEGYVKAGIYTI